MVASQTLPSLPYELFEDIIHRALLIHPSQHAICSVNSTWAEVSLPLLHSNIRLTSPQSLSLFSMAEVPLRCSPQGRNVDILLPGGMDGWMAWLMMTGALARCEHSGCCRGVKALRLCLNSHAGNAYLVGDALRLVNPEVFIWSGPDPVHHFSTAIVTGAVTHLCQAVDGWTSLKRLELSNLAFPDDGHELARALINLCGEPPTPEDTDTRGPVQVVISQAVFMLPAAIIRIALGVPGLRELRLIDVYQHSIWGPRLRMSDVERTILATSESGDCSLRDNLKRVREVVTCAAKTERLIGGDREVE